MEMEVKVKVQIELSEATQAFLVSILSGRVVSQPAPVAAAPSPDPSPVADQPEEEDEPAAPSQEDILAMD